MSLNRLSGLFFVLFGLTLYFVIIPYDTEVVDYGWVKPQSLPNAMAWIMVITGAIHTIRPTGEIDFEARKATLALLYFALIVAAIFLIGRFGFAFVSPFFALALMMLIGERRPFWLGLGVIVLPLLIWFVVTFLLERPLP